MGCSYRNPAITLQAVEPSDGCAMIHLSSYKVNARYKKMEDKRQVGMKDNKCRTPEAKVSSGFYPDQSSAERFAGSDDTVL